MNFKGQLVSPEDTKGLKEELPEARLGTKSLFLPLYSYRRTGLCAFLSLWTG